MPANAVFAAKSLFKPDPAVPPKNSASPATGAVSRSQLPGSVHVLASAPPSQVLSAARDIAGAAIKRPAQAVAMRRWVDVFCRHRIEVCLLVIIGTGFNSEWV